MSYLTNNLLTGETVTYRTKLHWKLYIVPALLDLVVLVPITFYVLMSQRKWLALVTLTIAAAAFVPAYLRRMTSEFAVTNKRVLLKVGVLNTRSFELLLNKVEGIAVNQGLFGKLLNYGDIVVTGSGGTQEPFRDIENPLRFRTAVQSVTDSQTAPARSS